MSSKKLVLAAMVVLLASLVNAAAVSVSPATPQVYDSKGKLVGTPVPYVDIINEVGCEFFSFDCEFLTPPPLTTAASVALKYSLGGTFYLNIWEEPFEDPPSSNWLPDTLYYANKFCIGQAYSDTGNFVYPMGAVLTTRVGAVNGTGGLLYISALNPIPTINFEYQSYNEGFGCQTPSQSTELPNAIPVNPTGLLLNLVWTPPFHIQ